MKAKENKRLHPNIVYRHDTESNMLLPYHVTEKGYMPASEYPSPKDKDKIPIRFSKPIKRQAAIPIARIPFYLISKPLLGLSYIFDSVFNIFLSAEGGAGGIFISSGASGGINFATDPHGNMALVFTGSAFAYFVAGGYSTSKKEAGPPNGGSWYLGVTAGVSTGIGVRLGDKYQYVADLQGDENNFDFDIGIGGKIDVTFVITDEENFSGLEISLGGGIGGGFGMVYSTSVVFAFTDNDLERLDIFIEEMKRVERYYISEGYLGTTIFYNFTDKGVNEKGKEITTLSIILSGSNENKFSIIRDIEVFDFIKVNNFYYKTLTVIDRDTFKK